MKLLSLLFCLLFGVYCSAQNKIIPSPTNYVTLEKYTQKFNQIYIEKNNISADELNVMNSWIKKIVNPNFVEAGIRQLTVNFERWENEDRDAYQINFDGNKLVIGFTTPTSKIYAFSSLLQLIENKESGFELQPFSLQDKANFSWRGLHLDVCRHFFTVEEVKRYIDIMAFYKYNTFHWHLTDDQGWRIEIKKYPLLTEVGGYRDSTLNDHYTTSPRTWNTERYGGFYTQEQIKEVVKYAQDRGVTIVPEIEMPGHARAALAAYPNLSCTGIKQGVTGLWGVFDDIFCSKDETITFLQDVLTEVLELFPSEYIHIGGDEAPKMRWKACEKCQSNIKKYNLKDEHELQSWFVQQMDAFLTKNGRKLIGWDEILEGGLSPNAAVMSWRGEEGGIEAANQKHEVVMTPGSHCYFDHYQGDSKNEPIAFGGYTPLEKVYAFSPIPEAILEENKKYILGAQANLWTEYIPNFKQVEYMVYPRALAMIQNLWSLNKPDYNDFLNILKTKQFEILKAFDINYSISFAKPKFSITRSELNGIIVETSDNAIITQVQYPNSPPSFPNEKSIGFAVGKTNTPLVTITASEPDFNSSSSLQILQHKGLGVDVEFITPPNKRYSTNKEFLLVDGILGSRPWAGNEWLGFNNGIVEFIVTNDESTFKKVTVSALDATTSWIHLPEMIVVETSKDGKKWQSIAKQDVSGEKTVIELGKAKRFVKFTIIPLEKIPEGMAGAGYKPFTFLDELIFE